MAAEYVVIFTVSILISFLNLFLSVFLICQFYWLLKQGIFIVSIIFYFFNLIYFFSGKYFFYLLWMYFVLFLVSWFRKQEYHCWTHTIQHYSVEWLHMRSCFFQSFISPLLCQIPIDSIRDGTRFKKLKKRPEARKQNLVFYWGFMYRRERVQWLWARQDKCLTQSPVAADWTGEPHGPVVAG